MDGMEKLEWIRKHTTEPYDKTKECLITNYRGTKIVTEALLPLLQFSSHGRVVNVSSHFGLLRVMPRINGKIQILELDLIIRPHYFKKNTNPSTWLQFFSGEELKKGAQQH